MSLLDSPSAPLPCFSAYCWDNKNRNLQNSTYRCHVQSLRTSMCLKCVFIEIETTWILFLIPVISGSIMKQRVLSFRLFDRSLLSTYYVHRKILTHEGSEMG